MYQDLFPDGGRMPTGKEEAFLLSLRDDCRYLDYRQGFHINVYEAWERRQHGLCGPYPV